MKRKGVHGGLQDWKLYYEPINGDRKRFWKVRKLKRTPVHYVLGVRVSRRKWWNYALYRTLERMGKDLRRSK